MCCVGLGASNQTCQDPCELRRWPNSPLIQGAPLSSDRTNLVSINRMVAGKKFMCSLRVGFNARVDQTALGVNPLRVNEYIRILLTVQGTAAGVRGPLSCTLHFKNSLL